MVAEARSLMQGIYCCVEMGYVNGYIEVDSLILVQVLKTEIEVPWSIVHEVRLIWRWMGLLNCSLSHTYRENNKGVDFLANLGCCLQ